MSAINTTDRPNDKAAGEVAEAGVTVAKTETGETPPPKEKVKIAVVGAAHIDEIFVETPTDGMQKLDRDGGALLLANMLHGAFRNKALYSGRIALFDCTDEPTDLDSNRNPSWLNSNKKDCPRWFDTLSRFPRKQNDRKGFVYRVKRFQNRPELDYSGEGCKFLNAAINKAEKEGLRFAGPNVDIVSIVERARFPAPTDVTTLLTNGEIKPRAIVWQIDDLALHGFVATSDPSYVGSKSLLEYLATNHADKTIAIIRHDALSKYGMNIHDFYSCETLGREVFRKLHGPVLSQFKQFAHLIIWTNQAGIHFSDSRLRIFWCPNAFRDADDPRMGEITGFNTLRTACIVKGIVDELIQDQTAHHQGPAELLFAGVEQGIRLGTVLTAFFFRNGFGPVDDSPDSWRIATHGDQKEEINQETLRLEQGVKEAFKYFARKESPDSARKESSQSARKGSPESALYKSPETVLEELLAEIKAFPTSSMPKDKLKSLKKRFQLWKLQELIDAGMLIKRLENEASKVYSDFEKAHEFLLTVLEAPTCEGDRIDNWTRVSAMWERDACSKHLNGVEIDPLTIAVDIVLHGMEHVARRYDTEQIASVAEKGWFPQPIITCPYAQWGKIKAVDHDEIDDLYSVDSLLKKYIRADDWKRPLSIAIFGPPGSGKNFTIKELLDNAGVNVEKTTLEFNVAQFTSPHDLSHAFHCAQDINLSKEIPLVVFDEFDCNYGTEMLGWLKFFLMPMQDGKFVEETTTYQVGRAILLFAGGVTPTYGEFRNIAAPDAFRAAKGPDFISRLRGHLDIKGIDCPDGKKVGDILLIRRAILLHSFLGIMPKSVVDKQTDEANIDKGIVRAFLQIKKYRHGVRSMLAILEMADIKPREGLTRRALPMPKQLEMHVDSEEFLGYLN